MSKFWKAILLFTALSLAAVGGYAARTEYFVHTTTTTAVIGTVDINAGAIDGTVIGGTTPAPGDFTDVAADNVDSAAIGANTPGTGVFTTATADDVVAKLPLVDVRAYATINAAVAAISTTEATLLIPDDQTLASALTVPATLDLMFLGGGQITLGTYNLVINSHSIVAPLVQIFDDSGAGAVSFGLAVEVFPQWWGASDIAASDAHGHFESAVASFSTDYGGGIKVVGRFRFDDEVLIARNGIAIYGVGPRHGGGGLDTDKGSYILPGASITGSMFKFDYLTGTTSSRGNSVRDISFMDDYGTGVNQGRNYTIYAAVEVHGSDQFYMENCDFERLKGRAIWTKRMSKSSFRNIDIFRCGDTGKPALDVDATDGTYYTQGTTFDRVAIEVCYTTTYLAIDSNNKNNKFSHLGFETDNAIAASEQRYILLDGDWNQFNSIHFNKNSGTDTKFKITGNENIITNLVVASFEDADCVEITGARNQLGDVAFRGTASGEYAVYINAGDYNRIDGMTARYCGGVILAAGSIGNSINGFTHLTGETATIKDGGQETNLADIVSDDFQDTAPILDLNGNDTRLNGFQLRDSTNATQGVDVAGARVTVQNGQCKSLTAATAINLAGTTTSMLVTGNQINACNDTIVNGNAGSSDTRIFGNQGADETITADSSTLRTFEASELDSTSNEVDCVLPDGTYFGQIKTITMIEASNSSIVTITNHETENTEEATFDAVDEVGVFMWSGTEWITIKATCTFL